MSRRASLLKIISIHFRYMMLIVDDDEVYMIDRDNCIFKVDNLKFPHNTKPRHLRKTLLDGVGY